MTLGGQGFQPSPAQPSPAHLNQQLDTVTGLGNKQDPISKITRAKGLEAQMVQP
jgi:hypothetical protein